MSRAQELANTLIGCCSSSMPTVEDEVREFNVEDGVAFDELCFICECCGWYCSTDELNNLGYSELCDDCEADDAEAEV